MSEKTPGEFSPDQFQFILDQLPWRVFWKDKESRYLGCNLAFAQDAGLSCPSDIMGKSDFDLPWSANAAVLRAHDQEVIATESPFQADEEPINDLHGLRFWMHKNKMPMRNSNGDVIGVLGMYDDISPLKTIQSEDQKIKRAFNLLVKTNHAVAQAQDEKPLFSDVCRLAVDAGYKMAWIGLATAGEAKSVQPVAQEGVTGDYLKNIKISWADDAYGQGPTGIAIREMRTVVNQNFLTNVAMLPWRDAAIKMGYQASIAIPIAEDTGVMGALMVYAAEANAFDADELALLEELGKVLAFGIMGIRERKKRYEALISAVGAIAATVELRDPYTAGHQRHVADIAVAIASEMQLSADQIEGIRLAAIIHDVGKIGVPAEILSKPTKLSKLEFSLIQTHAEAGYDLLKAIPFEWPIAEMVHQHHERMDGSGYPQGLVGAEIELGARIIAVADVVDSMSSHRPYRAALGIDKALEELVKGRGTIYDANVVDACLKCEGALSLHGNPATI